MDTSSLRRAHTGQSYTGSLLLHRRYNPAPTPSLSALQAFPAPWNLNSQLLP